MTEIGTVIDGKYEVLSEIGRGGMSIVYLAMNKHLNKQWAIKEIKKNANGENDEIVVNSLLAEANMMKRLDHPALPRIVDIIDNGKTIYIVMDYIEGQSLDKVMAERGAQSEDLVIEWAKQLCDALSYLHSQKPPIIYRDMKPANVMLKPEGNIKIIDFGIAREYKEDRLEDTMVLGTKGYAPPEQHGRRQTDARSDIYALGMTMHHLLTGKDPRASDYVYVPVRQWNPELSDGIEIIIEKCTQPAAENRYQSCADLMYDLQHPHLITKDYKRKQKNKFMKFLVSAGLCIGMLVLGLVSTLVASIANNNNYDTLIEIVPSSPYEEKISSYKEAISIHPDRTDAYLKMLEAYQYEGEFGKEQNAEFLALYSQNVEKLARNEVDFAELNYNIGLMYFNYYSTDGSENFSERIQKAHPFFESNSNIDADEFKEKNLSDCYFTICDFYKTYILNSLSVQEASRDNYNELFESINDSLEKIEGTAINDQLSFYNSVFMLMYDQRASMKAVGVPQNTIQSMMKQMYDSASGITSQKTQLIQLREEIMDNYAVYSEAVERTYSNENERRSNGSGTNDNL